MWADVQTFESLMLCEPLVYVENVLDKVSMPEWYWTMSACDHKAITVKVWMNVELNYSWYTW